MSKSYGNTIEIFLEEKALRKKIMGIKTDSTAVGEPKPVEGSTLLALYRLVAGPQAAAAMEESFRSGGTGYGDYKKQLFAALLDFTAPMRARREHLLANPGEIESILDQGAKRANAAATEVMQRVRRAVGLAG